MGSQKVMCQTWWTSFLGPKVETLHAIHLLLRDGMALPWSWPAIRITLSIMSKSIGRPRWPAAKHESLREWRRRQHYMSIGTPLDWPSTPAVPDCAFFPRTDFLIQ